MPSSPSTHPTQKRPVWRHFSILGTTLIATLSLPAQAIDWYTPKPENSIARNWNERILEGIRMDTPHPPGQARNLFSFSVCMYDAWAAFDTNSVGFAYRARHSAPDIAAARREAISYAVYRMIVERHAYSRTATNQVARNPEFMALMGYDPTNVSRDPSTPAGIGNRVYDAVSAWFRDDGSRQTAGTPFPTANPPVAYPDYPVGHPRRYVFVNPPMNPFLHGINDGTNNTVVDVNRWQRLIVAGSIDQNGFPQNPLQGYLGAQWQWVRPFSLGRADEERPWIDPGPPPFLSTTSDRGFSKSVISGPGMPFAWNDTIFSPHQMGPSCGFWVPLASQRITQTFPARSTVNRVGLGQGQLRSSVIVAMSNTWIFSSEKLLTWSLPFRAHRPVMIFPGRNVV
jgi:hypothetical protein